MTMCITKRKEMKPFLLLNVNKSHYLTLCFSVIMIERKKPKNVTGTDWLQIRCLA